MVRLWALERVWSSVRTSDTSVERIDRTSGVKPVDRTRELLPLLALCVYLMAIVKAGWLADDAFASFRAAANLVNGHGLLSNPPERVQAFTSPLWMLLFALLYWPAKNAYAVAISLGLVCSIAAAALIAFSRRVDALSRALAVLALCLSMAFVDFSTSGLENPLAHLLLVAIYVCERRDRGTLVVALLSAFLAVNRLDHLLLVAPLLAARLVRAALLGRARRDRGVRGRARGFRRWPQSAPHRFPRPHRSTAVPHPRTPPNRSWRIGHFYRTLPDGYLDTVRSGKNLIKDPCLARFYTRLHNVTSGPMFSWARVKDALWLNFREPTTAACAK